MSKSDFVFNTRPLHDHTIFDLTNESTEISSSIRVLLEYGDLCSLLSNTADAREAVY